MVKKYNKHSKLTTVAPPLDMALRPVLLCITAGLFFALTIQGCTLLRATPAPATQFLSHAEELKPAPERFPFHSVWTTKRLPNGKRGYKRIYVAPVNLSYLTVDKKVWQKRIRDTAEDSEDLQMVADYLRQRVVDELRKYPTPILKVTEADDRSEETVVLELAIVQLLPTGAAQKVVAKVAGLFIPGGGLLATGSAGMIAIEGRGRDSATREIVAEFADRRADKLAPVDISGFTWYSRIKENIDDWAREMAKLANTPMSEQVEAAWPLTLMP